MFIESYQLGYCIYDKSFQIIDRHGDFNTHVIQSHIYLRHQWRKVSWGYST